MNAPDSLYQSALSGLPLRARGKVRDIYEVDADHLLIVTTDRISAFDCILPDPIPGKGRVLTAVSNFWFRKLGHMIPNHLCDLSLERVLAELKQWYFKITDYADRYWPTPRSARKSRAGRLS